MVLLAKEALHRQPLLSSANAFVQECFPVPVYSNGVPVNIGRVLSAPSFLVIHRFPASASGKSGFFRSGFGW